MYRIITIAVIVALLVNSIISSLISNDYFVTGTATVIDGDTLVIEGLKIHLHGIDAPEIDQYCSIDQDDYPCGEYAADYLRKAVENTEIGCELISEDRHGQYIAKCFDGILDFGMLMVMQGWALAYTRSSRDYFEVEMAARRERKGIHRGNYVNPWEWRDGSR